MEQLILTYDPEEMKNLVGKKGRRIKEIKKSLGINIEIKDSKQLIINKKKCKLNDFELINIFDALAMGFPIKITLLLRDPSYIFEKINLKARLRPARRRVIKARIIGKEGKTRKIIEEITHCYMKIFGNWIGLIGKEENLAIAKRAIEMLVQGRSHSGVYKWLEHARTKLEEMKELTEEQLKEIEE